MKVIGILALSFAVASTPAFAQKGEHGKGNEKGNEKQKTEVEVKQHGNPHGNAPTEYRQHGNDGARGNARAEYRRHPDARGNVTSEYRERSNDREYQERMRNDREYQERTRNGYVNSARSKGGAPAFCRSGAGHPVYGRYWCVQKGFGLGNGNWNRVSWGDVVMQPRRASIGDVLGSVILGRLTNYAATRLGLTSPLTGSWLTNTYDRRVYVVRSASTPVAELVDVNHDGRADYMMLYSR